MRWFIGIACQLSVTFCFAGDWPQLLGPQSNGVAAGTEVAESFPDQRPPLLWRANAGFGSSPAVISGDKVYVFGLFKPEAKADELEKHDVSPTLDDVTKGAYPSHELPGTPPVGKKNDYPPAFRGVLYAQCLDAATGKRLWATRLTDLGIAFKTNAHAGSGWELASPLLADGHLYTHTHTGHLYCLDASEGELKWECNLFDHRMSTWFGGQQGNSSGPLKAGDNILVSYDIEGCLGIGAFDAKTGAKRWITKSPKAGMNARSARISTATLDKQPTVLCSCGSGTMGLEPTTGKMLWWFDLVEANPESMKQVPAKYAASEKSNKDYKVDALRTPFPGFCPLAWENYVIDAACVGHNSLNSATWCLKIENGKAIRVWQTNDFVPTSASLKSSMAVRDGKFYGFDSYFPGFIREYDVTRPYRGGTVGEFQCRDVASGKLLWSSDAFNPAKPGEKRPDSTNASIIVADNALIVTNSHGLWIAQRREDGVSVTARVPQANRLNRMLGEPALADGRLFIRQLDADPKVGLSPALGAEGNLFCFDVKPK